MKSLLLSLCALALCGCPSIATEYVDADKATYDAVEPEFRKYVAENTKLADEQKQLRYATLDAWKLRIEAAEKDGE